MADKFHELMSRWQSISKRATWDSHWQELAEQMLPGAAQFTGGFVEGEKRTKAIYDGTPRIAARGLVSAIGGILRPRNATWLTIKAADPDLNKIGEAKEWLEQATEIQRTEMYRPRARFVQATGETDRSLVVFGTGCLFTAENRDLSGLRYQAFPLARSYIAEDGDGAITTFYASLDLTVRQAEHVYGHDKLGPALKELSKNKGGDTHAGLVIAVQRRAERNPRMSNNLNMEFSFAVLDTKSEILIDEGGFPEFPFSVPRWDTISGETYGRSPGMLALPDANTLQQQGKTNLRAGHLSVEPPMMMPDSGIARGRYMIPGKTLYYNAAKLGNLGLRDPIRPLATGSNLPWGREMQSDTRDQIFAAFFRNVFNLPVGGPQMTATEIIERKEEFIREIGSVFGRLETDYTAPIVERSFGLLARAGKFPPPPRILSDQDIRFEYESPIEATRKQIEVLAMQTAREAVAPLIAADPTLLDNYDGDQIVRDSTEASGAPTKWLRSIEDRDARRKQREERAQAAADAQAAAEGDAA